MQSESSIFRGLLFQETAYDGLWLGTDAQRCGGIASMSVCDVLFDKRHSACSHSARDGRPGACAPFGKALKRTAVAVRFSARFGRRGGGFLADGREVAENPWGGIAAPSHGFSDPWGVCGGEIACFFAIYGRKKALAACFAGGPLALVPYGQVFMVFAHLRAAVRPGEMANSPC